MQILPDKNTYAQLLKGSSRVPVCGQKKIPGLNLSELFQRLFANKKNTFLFESGNGPEETAHYSLMGEVSSRVLEITGQQAKLFCQGELVSSWDNPQEALSLLNFDENIQPVAYLPHFWGGWVGFMGYEAGVWFENLPIREPSEEELPDLFFMEVERFYLYDHLTEEFKFILSQKSEGNSLTYENICADIQTTWNELIPLIKDISEKPSSTFAPVRSLSAGELQSNMSLNDYSELVMKAKQYIHDGDIYQANLAQKFTTHFPGESFQLYKKLIRLNPSPFSGYLNYKNFSLISSSPERLAKVDGHQVETRPIAGTRPRGKEDAEDIELSTQLLLNPKERAEHLMLVDLERNDLGRICQDGTVSVTDFMFLEKYSHVSHIVSNIVGRLKPKTSVYDILKSVFPGGTITGCPKIRCMEIIAELEPIKRGPYSGSFGYIGFGSYLDLNIIIRSIIVCGEIASFHVGAGIVADSNPEKEYQETLDKAAAMIQALSQ